MCKVLFTDLREGELDLDRPVLFVLDGGTAQGAALLSVQGPSLLPAAQTIDVSSHQG